MHRSNEQDKTPALSAIREIMKVNYRRQDDKVRGRQLVAARCISQNELIFCERPLCSLQSLDNLGVLVCRSCRSFVGTPALHLKLLSGEIGRQQAAENAFVVPCRHACGEIFCSKDCEEQSWPSHSLLCTGLIQEDDKEHPLLQWKLHAVENNEIFLLVGDVISSVLTNPPLLEEKVKDFTMVPWWDVVTLSSSQTNGIDGSESAELEASCKRLCAESADLLRQALSLKKDVVSEDLVTPLFVSQIIGSFEQNSMGIRSRHPLCRYILENTKFRHEHISSIIQCLEREGFIGNDEKDCDSDCSSEHTSKKIIGMDELVEQKEERENGGCEESSNSRDELWDYSPDDIDEFLAGLKIENIHEDHDDLDTLFPPLDGTAMFSIACKMNHSCDPNVVVVYRDRQWGEPLVAHCIARRDIEEGEELCISYIETDQLYAKRREDLANYGFECRCNKCESEVNDEPNPNGNSAQSVPNDINEDDLFGDDDEEESIDSDGGSERILVGEEALKAKYEELVDASDASLIGAITPLSFGEVHSFVVQQGKQALEALITKNSPIATELAECIAALKVKKFSSCIECGGNLEENLYRILQKEKSWPDISYRQVYWVAAVTAAAGLAQRGRYLQSQNMLDKANILGLDFRALPTFSSFVARFAFEMFQKPSHIYTAQDCMQIRVPESIISLENCLSRPIICPIAEIGAAIDLEEFQNRFVANENAATIRGFAREWRATSRWRNLSFLSSNYGHRLIPIELGSILSKGGMKEQLVNISSFVSEYLVPSCAKGIWTIDDAISNLSCYMAQHALLDQIPCLVEDVEPVPHLCGTTTNPIINVWMGTGGTRTPLHFDSYDNMLVQVVGAKYVRIYGKEETTKLYVSKDSTHASQGNMSAVDCEREDWEKHPLSKDAKYKEVVLMPGDAIFIPAGAWHYVRSLSTSISVNYWWS